MYRLASVGGLFKKKAGGIGNPLSELGYTWAGGGGGGTGASTKVNPKNINKLVNIYVFSCTRAI